MHPAPGFAMLTRGDLRLVLSAPNPAAGGGQPMPDGRKQEVGTGLLSKSQTSRLPSRPCARLEPGSATISRRWFAELMPLYFSAIG
jgi:hypothetical protein